jgi:hypothetical protein
VAAVAASCSHLWASWSCRAAGETPARSAGVVAAVAASCSHLWGSWSCRAAGETPARKSTNKYRDSGPAISSARQEYRLSDSDYNRSDHDHRHPVWRRGAQRILLVGCGDEQGCRPGATSRLGVGGGALVGAPRHHSRCPNPTHRWVTKVAVAVTHSQCDHSSGPLVTPARVADNDDVAPRSWAPTRRCSRPT